MKKVWRWELEINVEFIKALTGVNWNKISVRVYIGDINAMMEKK